MSALPPRADMCSATRHVRLCQKRTLPVLFDHLVGAADHRLWDIQSERLCGFRLMVISTFVTCWTGRSAGLSPLRTRPVDASQTIRIRKIAAVTH